MIAFAVPLLGLLAGLGGSAAAKSLVTTASLAALKNRFRKQGEETAEAAKAGFFYDPDGDLIEGTVGKLTLLLYAKEWREFLSGASSVGGPEEVMPTPERLRELADIGQRRLAAKEASGQ